MLRMNHNSSLLLHDSFPPQNNKTKTKSILNFNCNNNNKIFCTKSQTELEINTSN